MKKLITSLLVIFLAIFICNGQQKEKSAYIIPVAGNSFEIDYANAYTAVKKNSIVLQSTSKKVSTYFKLDNTGNLVVKLIARTLENAPTTIAVSFGKEQKKLEISSSDFETYELGNFNVSTKGYKSVDFLSSKGNVEIEAVILEGSSTHNGVIYCRDNAEFYWTRRGPSCHLGYGKLAENNTYYYNEITVPKGQDVIGSYFMANGFSEGYFGIQVNSENERRVLFSVWSPFQTDDPNAIPEEQKIKLLKKGEGVYTGEFGNEGSGGQSFLRYNWKADVTYKFLLKGEPDGKGNTDYTAWFFAPENNQWQLIASFKRPLTNTYLKGFHSFLENFNPNQGYLTRQVEFKNQWTYNGQWNKITQARLTVDNTYRQGNRVDATGGKTSAGYFLKMGGFFDEIEAPQTVFMFENKADAPKIDFTKLP